MRAGRAGPTLQNTAETFKIGPLLPALFADSALGSGPCWSASELGWGAGAECAMSVTTRLADI